MKHLILFITCCLVALPSCDDYYQFSEKKNTDRPFNIVVASEYAPKINGSEITNDVNIASIDLSNSNSSPNVLDTLNINYNKGDTFSNVSKISNNQVIYALNQKKTNSNLVFLNVDTREKKTNQISNFLNTLNQPEVQAIASSKNKITLVIHQGNKKHYSTDTFVIKREIMWQEQQRWFSSQELRGTWDIDMLYISPKNRVGPGVLFSLLPEGLSEIPWQANPQKDWIPQDFNHADVWRDKWAISRPGRILIRFSDGKLLKMSGGSLAVWGADDHLYWMNQNGIIYRWSEQNNRQYIYKSKNSIDSDGYVASVSDDRSIVAFGFRKNSRGKIKSSVILIDTNAEAIVEREILGDIKSVVVLDKEEDLEKIGTDPMN